MLAFSDETLPTLQTDVLVVEVDCLGPAVQNSLRLCSDQFPEVVAAYTAAFSEGRVEPGQLIWLGRGSNSPSRVILFPTRVHPKSVLRDDYINPAMSELIDQTLRLGIKSLAILAGNGDHIEALRESKLRFLSSFAKVPALRLVWLSPALVNSPSKQVAIFTDGGAQPRTGVGGYGVVLRFGDTSKELSEGFANTNSSRMELLATIAGLEALKHPCRVRMYSDSRYVVDAVNQGWLFRTASKGWPQGKTNNVDLWMRFLDAYLTHEVEMIWVKGHAGVTDNDRCDELATLAMKGSNLTHDSVRPTNGRSTKPASVSANGVRLSSPKQPGDLCPHCHTALARREPKKHKAGAAYWYAWYLYCAACKRMYHVPEARVVRQTSDPHGQ